MPALSTGFYCYPWNIHDANAALDEFAGAGLTHVTIAATYHAGKFIQPRDPVARVYFPEDGAAYFHARPDSYGALKPQVAALTRQRDVLGELCAAQTLPVRAWTVLNHNARLGFRHPETVARNAWGDPYYYSLCPSHQAVREYATILCSDLAGRYDLQALLLETPGWLVYDHGYHHEFAQLPAQAERDALMGLCFCDACEARAAGDGLDLGPLRAAVRRRADGLMLGASAGCAEPEVDLTAFHTWRCSVVTSLLRDIRAAVRAEVRVKTISTCQRPHATCYLEGGDLAQMNAATDGLELPIYQPSPGDAAADLAQITDRVTDPARLSVILRPGHPDMHDAAQLDATLAAVIVAGVRDISFYNYGLLPMPQYQQALAAFGRLRAEFANG